MGRAQGANGCSDAFRHAFFNAINSKSTSPTIAKKFGDAHECDVPASEQSAKEMDLFNNELGRAIFSDNPTASTSELANLICESIELGNMVILDNPGDGNSNIISSENCNCN